MSEISYAHMQRLEEELAEVKTNLADAYRRVDFFEKKYAMSGVDVALQRGAGNSDVVKDEALMAVPESMAARFKLSAMGGVVNKDELQLDLLARNDIYAVSQESDFYGMKIADVVCYGAICRASAEHNEFLQLEQLSSKLITSLAWAGRSEVRVDQSGSSGFVAEIFVERTVR